jgi:hypothetical protein
VREITKETINDEEWELIIDTDSSRYVLLVENGVYESDSLIMLMWEMFKHRCWHLYRHRVWMD